MKRLLILSTLLLTNAAFASDDFNAVVKAVETHLWHSPRAHPDDGRDDEVPRRPRSAEHETRDLRSGA